jgi:hypothetical protein
MLSSRDASLVVIEFGGSWPRWLDVGTPGCVVMVAQHYEGSPCSLLTQVASRVTRIESAGWSLGNAVLACNDRTDVAAVTARSVLARGLFERMRRDGVRRRAELVLALGEQSDGRARHALVKLAATLDAPLPHTSPVRLCIRIGHDQPLYGSSAVASSNAA